MPARGGLLRHERRAEVTQDRLRLVQPARLDEVERAPEGDVGVVGLEPLELLQELVGASRLEPLGEERGVVPEGVPVVRVGLEDLLEDLLRLVEAPGPEERERRTGPSARGSRAGASTSSARIGIVFSNCRVVW